MRQPCARSTRTSSGSTCFGEKRVTCSSRSLRDTGHWRNLALFDASERTFLRGKSETLSPDQSTLHHIALSIDLNDYEAEMRRLERLGLEVQAIEHPWIHVRSLYFPDPDGNLLELVCYDEQVG
jgi:catechol 2,3-dioxygenase-like lactoylglutathione lyase family enzyme